MTGLMQKSPTVTHPMALTFGGKSMRCIEYDTLYALSTTSRTMVNRDDPTL